MKMQAYPHFAARNAGIVQAAINEATGALAERISELEERIKLDNAVCLCGCSEHETYDEGEACEIETHECLRVAPAVREVFAAQDEATKEVVEALRGLVEINEGWNKDVLEVIGRPPQWNDRYLAAARLVLARYEGKGIERAAREMTAISDAVLSTLPEAEQERLLSAFEAIVDEECGPRAAPKPEGGSK